MPVDWCCTMRRAGFVVLERTHPMTLFTVVVPPLILRLVSPFFATPFPFDSQDEPTLRHRAWPRGDGAQTY